MENPIDLRSWVKESNRRNEEIDVYMVNGGTKEVVSVSINPHFIAGLMKWGEQAPYRLVKDILVIK